LNFYLYQIGFRQKPIALGIDFSKATNLKILSWIVLPLQYVISCVRDRSKYRVLRIARPTAKGGGERPKNKTLKC